MRNGPFLGLCGFGGRLSRIGRAGLRDLTELRQMLLLLLFFLLLWRDQILDELIEQDRCR